MVLLQPVMIAGRLRPTGSRIVLGVDAARHLQHQRRAEPADRRSEVLLADVPRVGTD
jgi:hypothetical protein